MKLSLIDIMSPQNVDSSCLNVCKQNQSFDNVFMQFMSIYLSDIPANKKEVLLSI